MARRPSNIEAANTRSTAIGNQSLAHKLLIELLSYQFAFPVRWIETQNEIINKEKTVERYVEIGPAKVLATMAKKTASQHYASQPASKWSHLQFLSWSDSKEAVYYDYPEEIEDTTQSESAFELPNFAPSSELATATVATNNVSTANNATGSIAAPFPASGSASAVADVPLSAGHIVFAITAQKLKRPFDDISTQKSLRELSGGKSALQNELIGDFGAEFGNLPDGAEDLSLEALGDALQGNFSGRPGKQMSAIISKFISSKMPAGFNQNAIQDHLQKYWGLSKSHSIVPICFAVTDEPSSRLAGPESAKDFLNSLVPRYASYAGISLTPGGGGGSAGVAQSAVMVDSASLNAVKKEQRDLNLKQFALLAKHLQIDQLLGEETLQALIASDKELKDKLNRWNLEFDEPFFDGIQPSFDPKKGRTYDSWWNWVREDIVRLFNELETARKDPNRSKDDERILRILSKWEPTCVDIIETLASGKSHPQTLLPLADELSRLGSSTIGKDPIFKYTVPTLEPKTTITVSGNVEYSEIPRKTSSYSQLVRDAEAVPVVHIRKREQHEWVCDVSSTNLLLSALEMGASTGLTYAGKAILVTGAGPKSIGAEIVQGLLAGGARVVVTTSRKVSSTATFYQQMYRQYGAKGSSLTVLPFNQGSKKDCEALIEHIYGANSPIGGDLDFVVPFAALPDAGQLDGLDSKSELAHRAMLVNLLRLLGCIKREKEKRGIDTRPANVILPLSPNHGTFGGDGLYSESKLGLETLFNRFYSESWSDYITVCGAVIGWTRGTGLMNANNIVAEAVEKQNVMTFSQTEMAFNILVLMTPAISVICEDDPVYADLSGGLQTMANLKQIISTARAKISDESLLRKALLAENSRQETVLRGEHLKIEDNSFSHVKTRRANLAISYPMLPDHKDLTANLHNLEGMVDLSKTVVVVGYSELSSWGSSRTRWEMEHLNSFTIEGYVEMAWIMGLVKHFEGDLKGSLYVGWVDAETNEPVNDDEFQQKYHEYIISHAGLRFIEPEGLGGYDPTKKEYLHEIAVEEDLPPFESSKATAEAFKLRHGEHVTIQAIPDSEDCKVFVKKGAHFLVPKAAPFDRMVAGQLPKGWDPINYGIPQDIVQQVDPVTLYALCCVSEALLSAGIKDPFELYKHIHVSELANCLGMGAGPLIALRGVYRDRYLDRPVQSDILQESFLNTMAAWINMLLLSSAGPIRSPAGTCATAIESLDTGVEAVQSGKCKVAIVGGCDDFQEEMSFEFGKMKATASSVEEASKDRLPKEMSRPSTTSRSGFVESAGCGVQMIANAEVAIAMGLPIYGIVAYTQMASDKVGRSVPAPGQGILTAAKEAASSKDSHLLDVNYRQTNFKEDMADIKEWKERRIARTKSMPYGTQKMIDEIESLANCKIKEAQHIWGNDIRLQDPNISPIKAALATWGLTIDDIQVASMHGTSTKANDINESDAINKQMKHLERRLGNPLLAVCQKSLTGHPKGAAGALQFNGCMQMLQTGIVPGNKNADNIDDHLRVFEHIVYPMSTIRTLQVKATMLTSFGFGQKGAIVIAVAPKYLFSVISQDVYEDYRKRVSIRQRLANTAFATGIMKNSIFRAKDHSVWDESDAGMTKALLDPNSRVPTDVMVNLKLDPKETSPPIMSSMATGINESGIISGTVKNMLSTIQPGLSRSSTTSVGVDVENITSMNIDNITFLDRNFTPFEQEYCRNSPNPRASFAGRWCAKEAIFKSMQVVSKGPGAGMNEIEVLSDNGVPKVKLHSTTKQIADAARITKIQVSITHSAETVTAVALAERA